MLTPQETEKFFDVLRKMKEDGKSIIIITHKLNEVLAISDRVAIFLRKGRSVGVVETRTATAQSLTEAMVGRSVSLSIERPEVPLTGDRLTVQELNCVDHEGVRVLKDVSFVLHGGEILGVAGVAGSGQRELCEALSGLQPIKSGHITTTTAIFRKISWASRLRHRPYGHPLGFCAGRPPGHGPGRRHEHGRQHDAQELPRVQGPVRRPQKAAHGGR